MESHVNRAAGIALVLVLACTASAGASDRHVTAEVGGGGVDLVFTRSSDGTARSDGSSGSCDWHAIPAGSVQEFTEVPSAPVNPRAGEDDELYVVWSSCDGSPRYAWLGASNFVDPTGPILEEILDRVAVRPALVDVRPDSRGITGIESLFWLQGPGTQQFSETVSAFGIDVTVTVGLAGVEWDFGDGTPIVRAGLGEAWPAHSSVRHGYTHASGDTPYVVTARLVFQPTYTVNGIPGAPLDPIVVPVEREYVVRQVQAVRQY